MVADVLSVFLLSVYAIVLAALFTYGANFAYLSFVAVRSRDRTAAKLTPEIWPTVTVQLPLYNEVYVAKRLIDVVAQLDYPSECLEIQVLDDSTDETVAIATEAVIRWQARGINIVYLHRVDRVGYKAGALAEGLASASGDLIAIFDADFVPQPDFLRSTVPAVVADPALAFVQARWGHVNRGSSLLTRLQAIAIDGHFGVEQQGRWARGDWFNFNGTAGVWRRAALIDGGGWQTDTLTEDLDMSYRAYLAGWRSSYLRSIEVPCELPVSLTAFRRQQSRWARGSLACARKHLPAVWRQDMPLSRKVASTLHLTGYVIHLLLLAISLIYPAVVLLAGQLPHFSSLRILAIFNLTALAPTLMFAIGQYQIGRSWIRQLPMILLLTVFGCGMMLNTARAAWHLGRGDPAAFERTAKFGVTDRNDEWRKSKYQLVWDRFVIVELAFAAMNLATCVVAWRNGFWAIGGYSALFGVGLASVAIGTIRQGAQLLSAVRSVELNTTNEVV